MDRETAAVDTVPIFAMLKRLLEGIVSNSIAKVVEIDDANLSAPEKYGLVPTWPTWVVWSTNLIYQHESAPGWIPFHFTQYEGRDYAIALGVPWGVEDEQSKLYLFPARRSPEGYSWNDQNVAEISSAQATRDSGLQEVLASLPVLVSSLPQVVRERDPIDLSRHDEWVGATLLWKDYYLWDENWNHDHCVLCFARFALYEDDETLTAGYAIVDRADDFSDDYDWICEECVRAWGNRLQVVIKRRQPE